MLNKNSAGSNSGIPDYISQSGTLTFAAVYTTNPGRLLVCAEPALEPDETFPVTLSGATNATIAKPVGTGIFFFNDTATTEIYTLSLHAALPICSTPPGTTAFAFTVSL